MADVDGSDSIFVYLGGEQVVPDDVTHVIIDRSVKIIPPDAFYQREQLVSVESHNTHEGIEKVGKRAFYGCFRLKRIKLLGVREVEDAAFILCEQLTDIEFGDNLETIGMVAFFNCRSLKSIKLPSVRAIASGTPGVFSGCTNLRRITIPLKDNLFLPSHLLHRYNHFNNYPNLTTIDLVGGIHKPISSLLLVRWRNDMNQEVDRINQVLPNSHANGKTDEIRGWIRSVLRKIEHYKAEHRVLLKEATTLLELAIWKAKLDEKEDCSIEGRAKKAKVDVKSIRKEKRITSGADIVIRSALPFLQLDE